MMQILCFSRVWGWKRLWILLPFFLLGGCAGPSLDDYQDRSPALVPDQFFAGNLSARGVVKDWSGAVIRTFDADITASWTEQGVGTLDEVFRFDDGEVQTRVWTLTPDGESYRAAGDVTEAGTMRWSGNAIHMNYMLEVAKGDLLLRLDDRQAQAKRQYDRARQLSSSNSIAIAQMDELRTAADVLQAQRVAARVNLENHRISAPFAGALMALWLTGISLNIYSQIGIIMLLGLMAKNGILIVEFANQLRDQGYSVRDAIVEGSVLRFRPVLMTTISTVFGAVPLVLATGAESRAAIGVVILGGLVFATSMTLFIVPVLYNLLARFASSANTVERKLEALSEQS